MLWSRFALRYMFSPKSHSVINIIAWVSLIAVAVPTAAMIILLAMFDGLTESIDKLNTAIDADIEIVAHRGQTFSMDDIDLERLSTSDGVMAIAPYIEQSVMAVSERNFPIVVRGVDMRYFDVIPIDGYLARGSTESILRGDVILGSSIASSLAIYGLGAELELMALNRKQISTLLPTSGISKIKTRLGGIISANNQINESVAIIELERAQGLLNHKNRVSAIAIKLEPDADIESAVEGLRQNIDDSLDVVTRDQKNASINAILRMEKFAIVLIGALIALIATFAIVGSVVMLMTEKHRDIVTLRAMGAKRKLISNIFTGEGMMLTSAGTIIGAIIGIIFTLIQSHWGVVKIPGGGILESYPVSLSVTNIAIVISIVLIMGVIVSIVTVRRTLSENNTMK